MLVRHFCVQKRALRSVEFALLKVVCYNQLAGFID